MIKLILTAELSQTIHSRRDMTTIVQSLYFSVLPERHVAVRIEDAVEPRPARDGGGGRGRRRLSPHGQQRRPLCCHLVHLLLILEVSFLITDCL